MKNLILALVFIGMALPLSAQRFGYVDTDYILENLPQYTQAQQRLKTQTEQWNQEIQNRQEVLKKRQADYLNEKVLLTDEQAKKEQEDLDFESKQILELQEKRYGENGDLIKLRKSLVKPIQDQVWVAVKDIAEKRNYGFIFDKGSDLIMVYTDPKFDISREVLLQLNPNAIQDNKNNNNNTSNSGGRNNNSKGNTNTNSPKSSTTPSKGGANNSVKSKNETGGSIKK